MSRHTERRSISNANLSTIGEGPTRETIEGYLNIYRFQGTI